MKIEVNISKKYAFAIIGLLVVLISGFGVYAIWPSTNPAVWHDASMVKVAIGSNDYSLQEAITGGLIGGGSVTPTIKSQACPSTPVSAVECHVSCDNGKKVSGGGCYLSSAQSPGWALTFSYPDSATEWGCNVKRTNGAALAATDYVAWVICV